MHGPRNLQPWRPDPNEKQHPKAKTIAHPECPANILQHSDFVGGTEAMVKHVGTYKEPTEFLVATEANMMWEMERNTRNTHISACRGDVLVQQVPPHGPQHAGEGPRLHARRQA